jgi:hypothetical protein
VTKRRAVAAAVTVLALGLVVGGTAAPVLALVRPAPVVADLPQPTGPSADPAGVRQQAQQILSRPEYQPPPKSLIEQITDKIRDLFGSFLQTVTGGGSGSIVGIVIIAALVGLVAFVIVKATRGVQRGTVPAATVEINVDVRRSPNEWLAEAGRLEAEGRWKEALRCRYRALAAQLVARKVVPDIPGRTVGEHRADVRTSVPSASPSFDEAAELFEEAWYGDQPTGPEENARFRAMSDSVDHEVAHGASR